MLKARVSRGRLKTEGNENLGRSKQVGFSSWLPYEGSARRGKRRDGIALRLVGESASVSPVNESSRSLGEKKNRSVNVRSGATGVYHLGSQFSHLHLTHFPAQQEFKQPTSAAVVSTRGLPPRWD
jgi:hypothetical protein